MRSGGTEWEWRSKPKPLNATIRRDVGNLRPSFEMEESMKKHITTGVTYSKEEERWNMVGITFASFVFDVVLFLVWYYAG